ncbi:hypothetical protein [Halosimplex halobium]|uniref:hypothetical protein n=1 Tax=Halosimplex halobium TaxID=3396618 RepID=UPI003F54EAB4
MDPIQSERGESVQCLLSPAGKGLNPAEDSDSVLQVLEINIKVWCCVLQYMEDPDLEDALDGLIAASAFCEEQGHHELSHVIGHLYQRLGDLEMGEQEVDHGDLQECVGEISAEDRKLVDTGDDTETGPLRETIIRFDPDGIAPPSMPGRLRASGEDANIDEIGALPERRVFGVGSEQEYERISEAVWGVANAFVGSSLHAGHELVACPECGYEGSVNQAVFPGGTDHYSAAGSEDKSGSN